MSSAPPAGPGRRPWATRLWDRVEGATGALRRRWGWVDHLSRAWGRYQRAQGDLLAAGVTYFAFLGLFPALLLVASIIGLVLSGDELLQQELFDTIRDAFPGRPGRTLVDQLSGAIDGAEYIGLIGLAGSVYAGLRAMDKLRIGMEQIWKGRVDEPDVLRDNLQDLLALVALGVVGLVSLGLTGAVTQATSDVLQFFGVDGDPGFGTLTRVVGMGLALAADVVVFLWLLRVVPSVSHPLRRLLPGALFGAVGFEGLKLIGGYYLSVISDSVTASAFGGTVGLLVWINLVARLAFFTAAWTATLPGLDRTAGRDPVPDGSPAAGRPG